MKLADLSLKDNGTRHTIGYFQCILCGEIISCNDGYTDRKGRRIALEGDGPQQHRCPWEMTQGVQSLSSGGQGNVQNDQNDHFHQWRR